MSRKPKTGGARHRGLGKDPHQVLREVFGFDHFRPLQTEVIQSVLAGRDTLAIMPTGGGKSLCYQLPALIWQGLTVVISPLISLMADQLRQLEALGIDAAILNSTLDRQTYERNREAVRSGSARLLYLAPETLFQERTLVLLDAVRVDCLTIDEAHCISEWGHDFRPEYRKLASIRDRFADAVCLGLTATATQRVRDDISTSLGFDRGACFVASFDRPNLVLRVEDKDAPLQQLLSFIARTDGRSGIVYCATRKAAESLAGQLSSRGLSARPYHAGLPAQERRQTQEAFIRDDIDIVTATVAFGMGINKPDVRFVAHHSLPKSIESYYQEIGRAGRDGLPADCLLLFGGGDLGKVEYFISQKETEREQRVARLQLSRVIAYAESTMCRRKPLLDYFGETYTGPSSDRGPDGSGGDLSGCGACDNCLDPQPDLRDISLEAQKFLSCVYRTGQRFGSAHIIAVLRGSKARRVAEHRHDELSTYGVGKDLDAGQWRHIGRQLLQQGLLLQDPTYGGLSLSATAGPVLRGEIVVEGRLRAPAGAALRKKKKRKAAFDGPYDEALFEELRSERKRLADEANVPPYVVFSDRTLYEMASQLPRDESALLALHGIGQVKLARYGAVFLAVIKRFGGESTGD